VKEQITQLISIQRRISKQFVHIDPSASILPWCWLPFSGKRINAIESNARKQKVKGMGGFMIGFCRVSYWYRTKRFLKTSDCKEAYLPAATGFIFELNKLVQILVLNRGISINQRFVPEI
jgi:hypothetical protein